MQLIQQTKIDFVGKMKIWLVISLLFILIGIVSLLGRGGLNYGVDFAGGSLIQLRLKKKASLEQVRKALKTIGLGQSEIQQFGEENDLLIRSPFSSGKLEDLGKEVVKAVEKELNQREIMIRRLEMVGPKAGKDLRKKGLLSIYYALLFMAVYISGRFEAKWLGSGIIALVLFSLLQLWLNFFPDSGLTLLIFFALGLTFFLWWIMDLKYAFAAVLALIHDVLITIGFFSLTNREITLTVVAAFLTLIGYSVNDTIVIFDRIRENLKKMSKKENLTEKINFSINQNLSRTILTSFTTLLVVTILFLFGGEVIHDFAFAIMIGVLSGTYSSIFIASPVLVFWPKRKKR